MTSITVRNIEEDLKRRLRIRAAEHGHSMEEEARRILRSALGEDEAPASSAVPEKDLGTEIHELFKSLGGVDLEIPPRTPMRELPTFD
ncbi:MAG: plasmid stabilization protein [Chloroflexi bacterium]|nr:plasmid stabilization protein [Chloroflexota bacterium]